MSAARKALGGPSRGGRRPGRCGRRPRAAALPLTVDGGRFSAHGAPSGGFSPLDTEEATRRGIELFGIADVQFDPTDLRRFTSDAYAEAAAGRLRPVIGQVFPLERAAQAHAAIEGRGLVGKVVLEV
ncbi:zinc-binding dehydrogenase [Streptomyces mirabilis]|nr:zinc-binding dehydrogenase [Streptomyces mirabilis]